MIRFGFKALVFLFVKLPLLVLAGAIKLIVLPMRLLALVFRGIGLVKYVLLAVALWNVAQWLWQALERRGERQPAA